MDYFPLLVPSGKASSRPASVDAPFDGSIIAEVETGDEGVAELALATAYSLYRDRDSWIPLPRRVEILGRVFGPVVCVYAYDEI